MKAKHISSVPNRPFLKISCSLIRYIKIYNKLSNISDIINGTGRYLTIPEVIDSYDEQIEVISDVYE